MTLSELVYEEPKKPLPVNPNRDMNVQWFEQEVRDRFKRIEAMLELIYRKLP
jgi:hypothetical protein